MKVSYYPGCSLHATGKEYDQSMKSVSHALGIELKEVEDWSCCGASSAHSTNFDLSIALSARNLIAAEKNALDVMVPCAACFNRFKMAEHHLKDDKELKTKIEGVVGAKYQGGIAIRNPIDVIFNDIGIDTLTAKVVKPLTGLKPVSYYGCLLLRPPEICEFENYENPFMMDKILNSIGADVKNWSYKTDCCGGSLSISKTSHCCGDVRQTDECRPRGRSQLCRNSLSSLHGQPGYASQQRIKTADFLFYGIDCSGNGSAWIKGNV